MNVVSAIQPNRVHTMTTMDELPRNYLRAAPYQILPACAPHKTVDVKLRMIGGGKNKKKKFTRRGQSRAKDEMDVAAKEAEDRAGARELQQAVAMSDEEAKRAESIGRDSLVKLQKQLSGMEADLSLLLSDKFKLEAKRERLFKRISLQKLQEK